MSSEFNYAKEKVVEKEIMKNYLDKMSIEEPKIFVDVSIEK